MNIDKDKADVYTRYKIHIEWADVHGPDNYKVAVKKMRKSVHVENQETEEYSDDKGYDVQPASDCKFNSI